jgi:hypothetical protein
MTLRHTSVVCAMLIAGIGCTYGAIAPIAEFNGDIFEGFEAIGPQGGYQSPLDIFGGQGEIDDTVAHTIMIATSLFSGLTGDQILPYNGNLMGGSVTGWAAISFDTPVTDFGGYIGTADELGSSSVTFFDASGGQIDSLPIVIQNPIWAWHGWHSDTPIARVEFQADLTPGKPLVFDDLRAIVPEPGSLGLLVIGAAAFIRRR